MTKINITLLIKNQMENDLHLKHVLNVNLKNPTIPSRIFFSVIVTLLVVLSFLSVMLLQQIQALQTQMNLLVLTCQDNNQYNHVNASNRLHQSINYNNSVNPIIFPLLELSNQMKVRDDRDSDTNILMSYNQIVLDQSTDHENNTIKRNASSFSNVTKSKKKMTNLFFNSNNRRNFLRSETQNYTTQNETSSDHWLTIGNELRVRRLRRSEEESTKWQQIEEKGEAQRQIEEKGEAQRQSEEKDETQQRNEKKSEEQRQREEKSENLQQSEKKNETRRQNEGRNKIWRHNEEKSGRRRQSKEKGEKRRQNRGGRQHNHKRSRPLVATFVGAVPEQKLTNTVYIGPWVKSESNNHRYEFTKFHLVEDNMSIQVGINGLYSISVQIFYFGNSRNYSYWVLLNSEGSSTKRNLVVCATASSNTGSEISCYTSINLYLQKGDRLSLQQREKDRMINMRQGYSQIQITLLPEDRR